MALYQAVDQCDVEKATRLLRDGADVNGMYNGVSPLYCALGKKKHAVKMVDLLLEWRADPNAKMQNGLTPLQFALRLNPRNPVVPLMVSRHPDAFQSLGAADQVRFSCSLQLVPPVTWDNPAAGGVLVNVTQECQRQAQYVVNEACTVSELGKGRNNQGTDHKGLKVEEVFRVENRAVWDRYQFRRAELLQQMQQHGQQNYVVDQLEAFAPRLFLPSLGTDRLSKQVNEMRLFHGTKRELSDIIVSQGMDDRVSRSGLHGAGLYFAGKSSKSDEYMVPAADGLCDLFVCRVQLGMPSFQTKASKNNEARRPPCVEGHHPCNAGHRPADSLIADVPGRPREFVVFDRSSVLPEFLLRVRRVDTEPHVDLACVVL